MTQELANDACTRFSRVRRQTEELCAPLSAEDAGAQSMPDASPAKWHLAHTSWFFETFVLSRLSGYGVYDAGYAYLFNSYYEALGSRHPRAQRGLLTRPGLAEVMTYRAHVTARVCEALRGGALADSEALWLLELGVQHEQQHQELLLTDIKHLFSLNPLLVAYRPREPAPSPRTDSLPPLAFVEFDAGVRELGHDGRGFAFDNEQPRHRVFVEAFQLASRPVTNAEYLEFVADGGYERPELWLSDGFRVCSERGWRCPLYWQSAARQSAQVFTLAGLASLAADEPVCHVSYYEADAYARWAGARLPTESEWELAARRACTGGNFLASGRLHPAPALRPAPTVASQSLLLQVFGDVWEWTSSAYAAYPGYAPAAGALGEYNGKFMCNQLVLRGGSCVTPEGHVRASYRNFFPPEARWQFSGIRLARSA